MVDKEIDQLPVANQLDDDSLLVVRQQGQARSIEGRLIAKFARDSVGEYVEGAKQAAAAAKTAQTGAEAAKDGAEAALIAVETVKFEVETAQSATEQAAQNAQKSAEAAADSEQNSADSALLAQSWAEGGTGSRQDEDSNNAKYWANMAEAEADRATTPAAVGVYNYILQDKITGDKYALVIENGTLALLGVSDKLDAKDLQLIDVDTGLSYELITESGNLKLLEVE